MAVGLITSPALWLTGTVAPATWFQAVQDNINAPGAISSSSLLVDGTGGATNSVPAGAIQTKSLAVYNSTPYDPGIGHLGINGPAPVSIVAGTGAGTGPTVAFVAGSSDSRGVFTVTTGTAPATAATIVTITLANAFNTPTAVPFLVFLQPFSSLTASLSAAQAVSWSWISSTSWKLNSNSSGLTASTAYSWQYLLVG